MNEIGLTPHYEEDTSSPLENEWNIKGARLPVVRWGAASYPWFDADGKGSGGQVGC